jgi:hypothetical protein
VQEDEPSIPGQPVTLVQDGKEIANVTSGEDGSYIFSNLAPGTYEVDDPIVVSITVKSLVVAPIPIFGKSSISGFKWNDLNGNGVKDAGEPGIANWQIALTFVGPVGGPVHDIILAKTKTDATGAYTSRGSSGNLQGKRVPAARLDADHGNGAYGTLPGARLIRTSAIDWYRTSKASIWGVAWKPQ